MTSSNDYTIDELMAVCISRLLEDGECVAQGIATPMVLSGYFLAKVTHAPNLLFASAIGMTLTTHWSPLTISHVEDGLEHSLIAPSFAQLVTEILPTLQFKEFLRPAQIDARGNTNNIAIGDYHHPRLRLPGSGGIPDVTTFSTNTYLYNPRHGRASFVPKLDFISGVGVWSEQERKQKGIIGCGPRGMVTDLGVFDFEGGTMRLLTYHPGVSSERIQSRTGFPIAIAPDVHETPPPSAEEVRLLREVIDPLGVRKLETLGGPDRWALLRKIAEHEQKSA